MFATKKGREARPKCLQKITNMNMDKKNRNGKKNMHRKKGAPTQ